MNFRAKSHSMTKYCTLQSTDASSQTHTRFLYFPCVEEDYSKKGMSTRDAELTPIATSVDGQRGLSRVSPTERSTVVKQTRAPPPPVVKDSVTRRKIPTCMISATAKDPPRKFLTPGPSDYSPRRDVSNHRGHTISKVGMRPKPSKSKTPDPLSYDVYSSESHIPVTTITRTDIDYRLKVSKSSTPDPLKYADVYKGMAQQFLRGGEFSSIGRTSKQPHVVEHVESEYQPVTNTRGITIGSRFRETKKTKVPGPGTYELPSVFGAAPSLISMASASWLSSHIKHVEDAALRGVKHPKLAADLKFIAATNESIHRQALMNAMKA